MEVVSFAPRLLYSREKEPSQHSLDMMKGWPHRLIRCLNVTRSVHPLSFEYFYTLTRCSVICSLRHRVPTGSGTHQGSYPMGTGDSFPRDKAARA